MEADCVGETMVAYCNQAGQRRGRKNRMLTAGLKAKQTNQGRIAMP
jgi:hypothetical protein